jgi:transcriptional regulator GlxA family with amidase domain
MRQIVILAFDGAQPLDVVGPAGRFAEANDAFHQRGNRTRAAGAPYQVTIGGLKAGRVRSEGGLGLVADVALGALLRDARVARRGASVDTVIVPVALERAAPRAIRASPESVRELAGRDAPRGLRLAPARSFSRPRACSMVTAPPHIGPSAEQLAAAYPRCAVERDPIYVPRPLGLDLGGRHRRSTMALAMVDEDLGPEIANVVARSLVVFIRRAGGQSQFRPPARRADRRACPYRELQGLIAERPDGDLSVPALARPRRDE